MNLRKTLINFEGFIMSELEEKKKRKKRKKAGTESSKESSLRDWFKRKGAKGKKGGWVDCNAPDGKGGYKSCGRGSGEKRKKDPACRPTPGACKERGRGKSWGKKGSKRKNEAMELTTEEIRQIIVEELQAVLDEKRKKKRKNRKKRTRSKGKRDACYHKVKSRYKVWPSAYASGALVKCRKVGAKNWGNKSKKNESLSEDLDPKDIDTILATFKEEGGALGMDPLLKALPDSTKEEIASQLKKMKNIKKHKDGDYIETSGLNKNHLEEAEYQGRKVPINKPMRGDVKKFKVYVKDPKTGNIKKVNFGHGGTSAKKKGEKTMRIRKNNPKARANFRARHNCDTAKDKTTPRYWSCKKW